jgi:hypothetical protein
VRNNNNNNDDDDDSNDNNNMAALLKWSLKHTAFVDTLISEGLTWFKVQPKSTDVKYNGVLKRITTYEYIQIFVFVSYF